MKNIVAALCLIFSALTLTVAAQNQPDTAASQDTLILKLPGRNQVFIINRSLRNLSDYQRADSLKNFFFADLQKTLAATSFPETPKRVHYLVNQAGKRRLKAEIPGEIELVFNLEFEKKRLIQDLPPLHYTIYDLAKNLEIHYFLEDSSAFEIAAQTHLNPAILELKNGKKSLMGLSVYKLEKSGSGWADKTPKRRTELKIEVSTYIGGLILGSQPSPLISSDIFVSIGNRPASVPNYFRVGLSYSGFVLSDFSDGQFKNINPGTYWNGILQFNAGLEKDSWLGLTVGQIYSDKANGLPKNAFKWGLLINHNRDSFGFDGIELGDFKFTFKSRPQMYMFTYRRSIF